MTHRVEAPAYKVLLVEDPLCKRDAFTLCNLMNQFPRTQVSARIIEFEDAVRAVQIFNPDIIFFDLNSVQRKSAFELAVKLRHLSPFVKFAYVDNSPPPQLSGDLHVTALSGYSFWINTSLYAKFDIASLIDAFRRIMSGDIDMPQSLKTLFTSQDSFLSDLTDQQRLIIDLLARGFSNKEIARISELKVKTVERNIARSTQILGVHQEDHESNKRILLVLEYLRRVDHKHNSESHYS